MSVTDDTGELTCRPLDSYAEVMMFLKDPPPWRSLCKELTPHSGYKINNMDINNRPDIYLDEPLTFCHYSPDAEDPLRSDGQRLPKTLVCHDMANGYHDDSVVDGTREHNAYTFYNWAGIDIFCYFSHHLITIPPLGWINIGHAHGVKVIGTVITEWSEGVKLWDEVLESEHKFKNFASALVAIAKCLKFDGWLLNVENKINKPDLLLEFVQHLHYLLHLEIPGSQLIWYDSVTIQGNLNWQNTLNAKNKPFFNACDGLFTNYSWTVNDLTTGALEAGDRITDLYIGIDVWGRNFHGGGQFNTQEAIKLVYEQGCSLAIFAPAWTHEAMSVDEKDLNYIPMSEDLDRGQQFLLRDRALWGSLWPFLNTSLPCKLPFKTSFCRGQGKRRRLYGEVISRSPWYNLRHQQYQPNSSHGPHGYLLSTEEVIRNVSSQFATKDPKSIIRYRESFLAIRAELLSVKHQTNEPEDDDQNGDDGHENKIQIVKPAREPAGRMPSALRIAKPSRKRSFKDCLRKLFGLKPKASPRKVSVFSDEEVRKKLLERAGTEEVKPKKVSSIEKIPLDTEGNPSVTIDDSTLKEAIRGEEAVAQASVTDAVEACAEDETKEAKASTSEYVMQSSGKSMTSTSLYLQLGQGAVGPYGRIALAAVSRERECLQIELEDSFNGGSCLRVNPSDEICREHRHTRLFHCDFPIVESMVVCIATKTLKQYTDQYLNVKLHTVSSDGVGMRVVLVGRSLQQVEQQEGGVLNVSPLDISDQYFRDIQKYLLTKETGFYVPVENYFGWTVRYYEVTLPGSRVTSVNLHTGEVAGAVLLGHFGMCHKPTKMQHTYNEQNEEKDEEKRKK